jgi:glycerate dehydrogenase
MNIVVLDKANIPGEFRRPAFDCSWIEYDVTQPLEVIERLSGAAIAVTNRVKLNEEHFSRSPGLKLITTNSTGYDTIDIPASKRYNITVCNVRDWCTNSVIEHIISQIYALRRNLAVYTRSIRKREWQKQGANSFALLHPPQAEVSGSTMAIFGHGVLGKHLQSTGEKLGIKVLAAERKNAGHVRPGYTAFAESIQKSDILVFLTPLTAETYNMISGPEFGLMKENAIVINCGRGGIIDEDALLEALKSGRIAGAALDVLAQEPPPDTCPLLQYDRDNLILTSHIAFASQQSIQANAEQVIGNIEAFYFNRPKNVVRLE